ncbi:hypothetical protein O9X98_14515 [Agrobacterium salinitolerans]|nr:hypothetical protein [Agrobacterium salinitolerans]
MRLAIIARRPSFVAHFSKMLRELYPDVDFSDVAVFHPIFGWYVGNRRFQFPHGLKWSDFPYVGEPVYRPIMIADTRPVKGIDGLSARRNIDGNEGREALHSADQILLLMDPHSSSAHLAKRFLADHFETIPWERTLYPWIRDLTEDGMRGAMTAARRADEFALPFITSSEIRRFFDYNFLVNSFALLGTTVMQEAGLRGPVPSKYGLQFLYDALDTGPLSDGHRIQRMAQWAGTGKYEGKRYDYDGLGTSTSRDAILGDLVRGGFLSREGKNTVVTEGGRCYLELLHPNCRDSDLPFRISEWAEELPEEEGRAKMTRYLRTFFGKQKVFIENRRKSTYLSDFS